MVILGIEGSEGITALTVSPAKKFLAICEKAERALCTVYEVGNANSNTPFKKRKIITSTDYNSREFISVAFATTSEKSHLCTLVRYHFFLNLPF